MVGVVIVNFRNPLLSIKAIESVLSNAAMPFKIVMVDNSEDNLRSLKTVESHFSTLASVINLEDSSGQRDFAGNLLLIPAANEGFAAANNLGINVLQQIEAVSHILFLNNDAMLQPGSLEKATLAFKHCSRLGLLGFCVLEYDESQTIQCVGGTYNFYTGKVSLKGAGLNYEKTKLAGQKFKIDYPAGAAMMASMSAIEDVGLMNQSFFLYGEELDWSLRMRQQNWTVNFSIDATVVHLGGASIGKEKKGMSEVSDFYSIRSRWMLSRSHSKIAAFSFRVFSLMYPVRRLLYGQYQRVAMYFWIFKNYPGLYADYLNQHGGSK